MGKCLKKKKKKQIKKKPTVVTIIFYGKLWSCKWAYRYESLERMPIWEYPKIGPWFEIMTSVDADLRSERRLETGRRSESIIYIQEYIFCLVYYIRHKNWYKYFHSLTSRINWFPMKKNLNTKNGIKLSFWRGDMKRLFFLLKIYGTIALS